MSRITTEIQRINRAKANLRTAIVAKGGTLSETAKIDEYADAVRGLQNRIEDVEMETVIIKSSSIRRYDISPDVVNTSYTPFWNPQRLILDLPNCTSAIRAIQNGSNITQLQINLPKCTNTEHLIHGCTSLREVDISLPETRSLDQFAIDCTRLERAIINAPLCTMGRWIIARCANIEVLEAILPSCTNLIDATVGCPKLATVKISGLKTSLNLSTNTLISLESVKYIVDNAQSGLSGVTLTLPRVLTDAVMEDDDILTTAVEKGLEVLFR